MANDTGTVFGYTAYPSFTLGAPRFPQDTFVGRWLHFLDVIDPRTLFTSEKRLQECIKLLEDHKNGQLDLSKVTDRQLWDAQKTKQAIIHPDTGQKIFMPFRMAGFVPFGWPTVVGLLLPNPSLGQTVFWQWINQSHNACVNYANRNASKPNPTSKFVQGYVGAVTTAVSIATGLSMLIKRADAFAPTTKMVVQRFVPLPAVACASSFNVLLMRWHERSQGIEVFDSNNNTIGTSQVAAKRALRDTTITRAALPIPIISIPPVIMLALEKTRFLKQNPRMHLPINSAVVIACFALALPVAIAMFPQVSQIRTAELEPHIAAKTNQMVLYYNKGL